MLTNSCSTMPNVDPKDGQHWGLNVDFTMEAAGIEPASENVPQESLHTCQVAICLVPRPKATCKLAGAQAR